ncbi:ABC transporter [Anaerocolumna cellulosilytica]|uniref:ABC transporter n=1 Tax=Anaerocolumna cellulosilytica TaxID=433286 RepID=A0A6S6R2M2_9FIRM|nr:ABC transporter ATP-binding protein [Anaerocolumna cellulosilytica]MBB5195960.1 putative ABC transport system ATP-binding protein [Anaerocolumna cellulosilytica]BCJ93742.1 ABC transporter [Anaerocolumna cellulosilytica]
MIAILKSEYVKKKYGKESVVDGISLTIYDNTFTVILGPSGSGKSTLLNILSGLIQTTSGKVWYEDKVISNYSESQLAKWKRSEVGNVFQNYMLLNNLTAEENIKIGIASGKTPLSFDRLVRMLEIESILAKFPAQLSGGQQQRVAIARAVIKAPRLLFCDEATGALDEENSKKVVELLHSLKSAFGMTILFATHNTQIAKTADRILTMNNGLIHKDVRNENPISAKDMVWG